MYSGSTHPSTQHSIKDPTWSITSHTALLYLIQIQGVHRNNVLKFFKGILKQQLLQQKLFSLTSVAVFLITLCYCPRQQLYCFCKCFFQLLPLPLQPRFSSGLRSSYSHQVLLFSEHSHLVMSLQLLSWSTHQLKNTSWLTFNTSKYFNRNNLIYSGLLLDICGKWK